MPRPTINRGKTVRAKDLVLGGDAWKTYVADAVGTAPARRSAGQKEAILQALRGDEALTEAERTPGARLAGVEERLSRDGDEAACGLTSVDWRLYAGWRPSESEAAARAMNAAVEGAVREGEDIAEALAPVRERHAGAGATDAAVDEVVRHVAGHLESLRQAPGPR